MFCPFSPKLHYPLLIKLLLKEIIYKCGIFVLVNHFAPKLPMLLKSKLKYVLILLRFKICSFGDYNFANYLMPIAVILFKCELITKLT